MNKNSYNTSHEPCDTEEGPTFTILEDSLKEFGNLTHDYHEGKFRSRLRLTPFYVPKKFSATLEGYGGSVYCSMISLRNTLKNYLFNRCERYAKKYKTNRRQRIIY